jgi:hypothetical protein
VSHILVRSVSFTELEGIIRHEQTANGSDWYNMLNIKYILEMFEEVYHAKYQLDRRNV